MAAHSREVSALNSRERLLAALERKQPDRLPATTHHLMPVFLENTMGGMDEQQFFDRFGLDPILWTSPHRPDRSRGEYFDPEDDAPADSSRRIISDRWRMERKVLESTPYCTERWTIHTPKGRLTMVTQSNNHTMWIKEHLLKEKSDIDVLAQYLPQPLCDVEAVNRAAEQFGDRGIVRTNVNAFAPLGQPGCWQDASCLYGIENLILETFDDPAWVHQLLDILKEQKKRFLESCRGAAYDLIELGGGDASSTVISPQIFQTFTAPYDGELIKAAHSAGQRIVYHTCGGMMPILEDIAAMGPDAMETFTPEGMGGDVRLAEAKARIGHQVCMIGGFDQYHHFSGCTPEETREAVRRCFEAAGEGGGYIAAASDHFFEAEIPLLEAFADEVRRCTY